jgi:hypothetical protein
MKKFVIAAIGLVAIVAAVGLVSAGYGPDAAERSQENFVDADEDGVCDNMVDEDGNGVNDNRQMNGKCYGPGDGTGNAGVGPKDGSGYGLGNGECIYDE